MVESELDNELPDRSKWAVYLAAADRDALLHTAAKLASEFKAVSIKPATSGLGVLQIQDTVRCESFHLGEFSASRSVVRLTNAEGEQVTGGAVIMADDTGLATNLAVLDAVLAARWPGWQAAGDLLRAGAQAQMLVEQERKKIWASTSVDFSTLDQDS